jgi:ParB-like nuclease domain
LTDDTHPEAGLPEAQRTPTGSGAPIHRSQLRRLTDLHPHPRNYRSHPADQIAEIAASMRQQGVYRNVVIARDGTILAGHGVVEAAKSLGLEEVPTVRLDLDPHEPRALKLVAADNELGRRADVDDRALTELLREIRLTDREGLLGTGFTDDMLAALVMVTRPGSEIQDLDNARDWIGLPGFDREEDGSGAKRIRLILWFEDEEERDQCIAEFGIIVHGKLRDTWSAPWPPRPPDDLKSLRWREEDDEG